MASKSHLTIETQHSETSLGLASNSRIGRPRAEPLWREHDRRAQKCGQKGTIYWVGRAIIGEDGSFTGERTKGASYHGEWQDNKKDGYGVQVFPNGEKYEGQWGRGLREGDGTLWVPVGKQGKLRKLYVGGWKNDQRHGRGTCYLKNGEFYQGSWSCGKMHGHGTLRYASGDLYVGEFYNGLRSGSGTLNKANGDCYEGWWLEDKREGSGSYFYAESGKVFVGEWANDLPKAGVYTQANQNPEAATEVAQTSVLPPVRLALPAEVLEGAIAAVRQARKPVRAQRTPVERLFSEEEVESLHQTWEAAQRESGGRIRFSEVSQLCQQLGSGVSNRRLRRLISDALGREQTEDHDEEVVFAFEEFLRVIALLLDEEASTEFNAADTGGMDSWEETGVMGMASEGDISATLPMA